MDFIAANNQGDNLKYLGLASGKISTYLRYGVPPVINNIGQYSYLANTHQFGLVAEDADGIGALLESLIDPAWSVRALSYYKEYLDFNNYRGIVWGKLCEVEMMN